MSLEVINWWGIVLLMKRSRIFSVSDEDIFWCIFVFVFGVGWRRRWDGWGIGRWVVVLGIYSVFWGG